MATKTLSSTKVLKDALKRSADDLDRAYADLAALDRAYLGNDVSGWLARHRQRALEEFGSLPLPANPDSPVPAPSDEVLPPGTDISSGITPTGLVWHDIVYFKTVDGKSVESPPEIHDGDTIKGFIVHVIPWTGSQLIDGSEGMRALGCDAYEVTKGRRSVIVTDEEVILGKECRDKLLAKQRAGAVIQAAPQGIGTRDNYGRPLVWFRFLEPDGSITNLAEWIHQNHYQRGGQSAGANVDPNRQT